ncbi:hypothetical protein [Rhodopseudomonas sp. P2A-2r]|uniref:hypothetical protein n=1 Tax=unclassified Rhodopseudomonas TaxID=2638247 RepID=UPI002234E58D|nr:hypothetical protein [Rhodopseudomonas sp. P2A-2r]UZE49362.1 hypothetical protein ONR75_00340 [Rhodopseudomonas sp. P2A-2r]
MTGKVPVARAGSQELPATIGRMDAILNAGARILEDSAGSPDADFAASRTASCRLARDFQILAFVFSAAAFREPMKEKHDV